jgi:CelD/BcsL family acetyltransferase involved in cellulose biosynthesis
VTSHDPARHRAAFLALADATYRRHGVAPRFAPEFYDALAALSLRDLRVLWRCCEHRGKLVASHVYLREHDVLHAWQSCFDRRAPWLRAGMFLRDAVAREAVRCGAEWLELGATPTGASGLAAYKRRWGGHAAEHVTRVRMTALGALAERFRRLRDPAPAPLREPAGVPPAPVPAAGAVR